MSLTIAALRACRKYRVTHWEKRIASGRKYRAAHREEVNARSRERRVAHREEVSASERRYRASLKGKRSRFYCKLKCYGLTQEAFDLMLVSQSGRCAVCGVELRTLHVDHDHDTGRVRGLLCCPCNRNFTKHIERNLLSLGEYAKRAAA